MLLVAQWFVLENKVSSTPKIVDAAVFFSKGHFLDTRA